MAKFAYKLVDGTQSNSEVQITITEDQYKNLKTNVLKNFQKDVKKPGFRKGHVPLDMVEESVQPYYIISGILEEVVHKGLLQIMDENKKLQLIGQPYDFDPQQLMEAKDGKYIVTFKIDLYPEFKEKDTKWEKLKINEIQVKISKEQKEEVLETVRRQYAEYVDTDVIEENSVARLSLQFLDKDGNEIHKKAGYVGDHEFKEHPETKKLVVGKKKDEVFETKYSEKGLPPMFHFKASEVSSGEPVSPKPAKLVCKVADIKNMKLPELTDEFIKKVFGDDGKINNKEELLTRIEQTLVENGEKEELQKAMDEYITKAQASFDCIMPKTFVDEELKARLQDMAKQLGGEKGLEKYFEQMGEEKKKSYLADIKKATETSLSKFFILKNIIEKLKYDKDIDRNQPLEAEKVLYTKMTGKELPSVAYGSDEPAAPKAAKKPAKKPAAKKAPAKKK